MEPTGPLVRLPVMHTEQATDSLAADARSAEVPQDGRAAFAAFYSTHYVRAVRVAMLLVDSRAVAEELAQDTFVEVLQAWERIDEPAAYLRVSLVNRCRSWGRRRRLEKRQRVDDRVGPDQDTALVIRAALRRLTSRQRAAIVLRYYEDLTEADTARVLGCRPGTAKSLVSRGLAAMKEYLDAD
jgi:RNA polymerase sigma-70 factor (sigma-E family)